MSACEWAAAERQRVDQERVERVLERITVKRRVYTPALARRRRFWMRVGWIDDHLMYHRMGRLCYRLLKEDI